MATQVKEQMLAPLRGRGAFATEANMGSLMYMPAGTHTIHCGLGDNAFATVTVLIDKGTAGAINKSLQDLNATYAPHKACFDKDHEGKEALAWPEEFRWQDGDKPGVYAMADYSSMGKEYVEGKVVRAFSPSFFTDAELPKRKDVVKGKRYTLPAGKRGSEQNPARVTGIDFPYAGTFTNNPAFHEIAPLWARDGSRGGAESLDLGLAKAAGAAWSKAAGRSSASNESINNKDRQMNEQEKAALRAKIASAEQEIGVLKAQGADLDGEALETHKANLQAKEAELAADKNGLELAELRAKAVVMEQALVVQREKDADAAIKAAVKRGAIAAQNTALQAMLKKRCVEDPEEIAVVNAMNGHVALQPRLTINRVQIEREASGAVLDAYAKEPNAQKRAVIYAKEIKPRLAEGDPMPLRAATVSLGSLAGTIVSQRTLELLKLSFPILGSISTDFTDQQAKLNQTVDSRIVSIPNVVDYDPANGWPDSDAVTVDVPVTLNKQQGVQITFTSDQLSSTVRRLFDEFGPAQAYALGKSLVDGLYALFLAANYTNAAIVAALIDFGRPTLIDIGVALDGRGVPDGPMNRFCLLNGPYYGQIKKDNAIVTLAAFQSKEIIEQGVLPDVEGFRTIKAVNLPGTANLKGFAGSKSAAVITSRVDSDYTSILPGASYGNVQTVTDPDIGISVLQVQYVNHQKASATQRISLLWGVAKGQDNAGQLLKSA